LRPAVRSHSPAVVLELPPAVQGLSEAEIKSVYSIRTEGGLRLRHEPDKARVGHDRSEGALVDGFHRHGE